jgi:hypothetical protein
MLRRLFTLLSALSLVLFVATCLMWIVSYQWCFDWVRNRSSSVLPGGWHTAGLHATEGALWFNTRTLPLANTSAEWREQTWVQCGPTIPRPRYGQDLLADVGFAYNRVINHQTRFDLLDITAPLWAFALAFLIVPWIWFRRSLGQRHGTSRCASCG